jgi:outer membrane protein assembly factor BamB
MSSSLPDVARLRNAVTRVVATAAALAACATLPAAARAEPAWTTYHRDSGRSGYDPEETSPITPVLAWRSADLGAPIWQQPVIAGNRAYIATVGNDLYALDTSTGAVIWSRHAGTPVPSGALPCGDITPTVGIVGTPVIDPAANAIYAVADTWNGTSAQHVLVGYRLDSGVEVLRTAVDPPGEDPKVHLQRPALTLDGGRVVFGFGGNDGDCGTYRGTVVSVPEAGGPASYWQVPIKVKTNSGGAIWGTSGPVVDGAGEIYASTGNPNPGGEQASVYDYSDSVVALDPNLTLTGWFEPPSWKEDSNSDTDLGSAGPELLPGGLLFQAGKNGTGYLIDTATMGGGAPAVYSAQVCGGAGSFGGDAYANGVIYVACSSGVQALLYDQTGRRFTPMWKGPSDAAGPPIVAAGLVWVVATHSGGNKLYGLDAGTGATRYTEMLPSAAVDHFASPSSAGGRLLLATGSTVTAYQIAQLPPGSPVGPSPAGPVPPPSGAPAGGAASRLASLVGRWVTASRSGRLVVRVRCPSGVALCRGAISLRTLRAVATGHGAHARRAILQLAYATFAIRGGQVRSVSLWLGRRARRLLARVRVLPVRVTLYTRDGTGRLHTIRATLTVRLAARRHRH